MRDLLFDMFRKHPIFAKSRTLVWRCVAWRRVLWGVLWPVVLNDVRPWVGHG